MNKTLSRGLMACLSLVALASCQDYDGGFDEGQIKKAAYAKHFEDTFGKIDPNQDWSMAAYSRAVVSGMEDGTLELLYSDPIAGTPVLIAKRPVVNGEAEFNFNVVKGTKRVFARIKNAYGNYSLNRYFEINDNEVLISNGSSTRAGGNSFTGSSRVTQGATYSLECPQLIDWSKEDAFYLKTSEMASAEDYIDGYYAEKTSDQNITGKDYFYERTFTNLIRLNNVISTTDERPWWYVSEIAPFFTEIDGQPACFAESQNHVKLMKEGSNPKLEKDLVFEMESNSPFYLDYFFEGTDFINDFGYFYFTGDNPTREQFMTMNKYVLVNDFAGNNKANEQTYIDNENSIAWNLLGMQVNTDSQPGNGIEGLSFAQSNWDTKVVGTRLPLTYFGQDGTSAGTYEFPQGTKIGIFLIGRGNGRDNMIITSIAKLNQDLYNEMPHAASFQIGDKVVFAMEDQHTGSDKDINDAMFIAHGNFKKDYIPNIIPTVEPEAPTWVMACEDLGGSFDYDFNDLVFGLRMTDKGDETSDLDLIPLAAGGTLDAKIEYDGNVIGEIHNLVKSGAPTTTPINVTPGQTAVKGQPKRLASGISSNTDINDIASQVKIVVTKGEALTDNNDENGNKYNIGYKYNEKNPDAADVSPQVLLLPAGWDWPSEGKLITEVYPGFADWTADADVTTWCNSKAEGVTQIVHNPELPATPSTDPDSPTPGGGGSDTPVAPASGEWDITIEGEPVMGMNTSQIITISVDGLSNYTNVECGTYSSTVITAEKVDNTHYTITGVNNARGVARFYVKVPGDATHATTRKVFEITVGDAVPEFYFYTTEDNENVRITSGALTLPVNPTNANVNLGIETIKGFGTSITWSTSDESIVKIVNGNLQRVACGTVTITATHAATDGGTNGSYSELSKSIQLTIERLDPEFTISPASIQVGERETKAFSISETKGQNSYTKWIDNEEFAIVTTLNGGDAVKGIAKGNTKLYVKHNQTQWYKELTKSIDVTVSESLLPEWTMSISPEVPSKMLVGEAKEFNISVTGEQYNRTGIEYSTNSLLSYTSNGFWVKITAGEETGPATFSITYPGDDATHKTTTLNYEIEIVAPVAEEITLTGSSASLNDEKGMSFTFDIPNTIDWSKVIKSELYFESSRSQENPIIGNSTYWQKEPNTYFNVTISDLQNASTIKFSDDWNVFTIPTVKLRITSKP